MSADSIHRRFSGQAASTPSGLAIVAEEGRLTYAQLESQADELAHHLRAFGVYRGCAVGLAMRRSANLAVGMLAVLKAGAAYVALDLDEPADRRRAIIQAAGIDVVLVADGTPVPGIGNATAVAVDGRQVPPGRPGHAPALPDTRGDDLAYLAFTSGSTGAPKGVAITHRAVLRLTADPVWGNARPDDRFLQFAPVAFDASTFEIWTPLLSGARLVFFPAVDPSLRELAGFIRDQRITCLWLTAGLFHQIAETQLAKLAGLRLLLVGGDTVLPGYVNRVLDELPGVRVVNGYGPTENTTFTCCHEVSARVAAGSVPIGRPVPGTGTRVLDPQLRQVAPGEVGELYATGAGLARGYLGLPAVTAHRFVADPWSPHPGGRMYRTGDLVRSGRDGTLEFLGRTDREVKVNGFRVDLDRVEAVVSGQAGVRGTAVVAQRATDGTQRVVCFLVPDNRSRFSILGLRKRVAELLPPPAAPGMYRLLDELPLTANGKVDRTELAHRRSRERPEVFSRYAAPDTQVEWILAEMWGDLLGISGIGVDDDFIELGGHSLLSMRITADIHAEFGVTIPPRMFYLNATVRGLARLVEESGTVRDEQRAGSP